MRIHLSVIRRPSSTRMWISETRASHIKQQLFSGGKKFVAIFLYLYVVFALFNMHEYIVLRQHHLVFTDYGWALVNALVLAKVVLVAEELHFGGRLEKWPLIISVVGKSILFAIVLIGFHVLEKIATGLWHGLTLAESTPRLDSGLKGIVIIAVIVSVMLVPFFALNELTKVIGSREIYILIFRRGYRDTVVEIKSRSGAGGDDERHAL